MIPISFRSCNTTLEIFQFVCDFTKKNFFVVNFQFCVISRNFFWKHTEFYHLIFSASSCSNCTKSEVTVLSSFCFSLSGSQGKKVSRCKVSRSTNSQFQLTLKPFRLLAISSSTTTIYHTTYRYITFVDDRGTENVTLKHRKNFKWDFTLP